MKTARRLGFALFGALLYLHAQAPPDFTPPSPLFRAVINNDGAQVKRLVAEGADPNEGRFLGFPPVIASIFLRNQEAFQALVDSGADIRATDPSGSTALMWAVYNDAADTRIVEQLLKRGVDPNAKNNAGETAMIWALRRGHTPAVEALKRGGADDSPLIKESVEKALALLQKSAPQFVKVSGCASCHNQSLPQMAVAAARERGFRLDEQAAQHQVKTVLAMYKPLREPFLKGTEAFPDPPVSVSYALFGLAAEGYAPDETTEAMAHLVATRQLPDGSFRAAANRPPLESSDFTATALSLRALQLYANDSAERVARAARWLERAHPHSNEDRAMQLLGLVWAKGDPSVIRCAANSLIAGQGPDGGWSQMATLETDAYATGQALVALYLSGQVAVTDPVYQRGIAYLLRTQLADGSWLVRSRSFPFQPYKESGFPHGKNQWISAAGTSWAATALAYAAPVPESHDVSEGF